MLYPPTRPLREATLSAEDAAVFTMLRPEDVARVLTPVATVKTQRAAAQPGRHRRTRRRWWQR